MHSGEIERHATQRNESTLPPGNRFVRELTQRRLSTFQFGLLVILLCLLHVWLVSPTLQNGDAAVYNEQIENRTIDTRTTHVGYMLLGIAFDNILPFGVEKNLNLMSLLFASVGGAALSAVAKSQRAPFWIATSAAFLAFGLPQYLFGATLAEVDVVACSLVLLALATWVHGKPILAGVAFGAAMLVTPLSTLSLPLILLTETNEHDGRRLRDHLRAVSLFAAATGVVYLPFVACFWQDYWLGGRGILHAPRQPWSVSAHVLRSVAFFQDAAGPWMLLSLAGLGLALWKRQSLAYSTLVTITLASVVGERFLDVPVQLPQLCLLTVFAAMAVAAFSKRTAAATALVLAWLGTAPTTYSRISHEITDRVRLRSAYLEMARQTPKLIVVGSRSSWDDGLPFERIVYGKTKLGLGLDTDQLLRAAPTIARRRRDYSIWLMSPVEPRSLATLNRNWHPEIRSVLGQNYEVWIPNPHEAVR